MSAGRLYDKIGKSAYAKVELVTPVGTICKVCKKSLKNEKKEMEITKKCVHPEHGVIDYFIENLTGIKNSQVKNAPKLEEALGRVEIEPEGNFHDGLDDAVNTGYLIEKLELNPEYQLVSYEMPDKPSERLSSTLGELFAGLDLRFT